jgi:hypothetical protein
MKPKLFFSLIVILILILPFTLGTRVASANASCDPAFVTQVGNEITVRPNGVNDTANLQCAFDEVPAGGTVRLLPGTFYTKQLVVDDFHGRFVGAGDSRTTIVNLPEMYVTPVGFDQNPPSDENPWPVLIYFVGGDFSIADLTIHIAGDKPTTEWQSTPDSPIRQRLASAIYILGTGEVNVEINEIAMSGEFVDHPDYSRNVALGIFASGQPGGHFGSFHVLRSSFMMMSVPIDLWSFTKTDVLISHNRFDYTIFGTWVEVFTDSSLVFSHNSLYVGDVGLLIGTDIEWEDTGNSYLVKNNKFQVDWGIIIDTIFGEGNQCLLLGNNVQTTVELGVVLGEGVHGCTVVGGSNKTNVWDFGYDNILVGVNNMGTAIGPTIRDFLSKNR